MLDKPVARETLKASAAITATTAAAAAPNGVRVALISAAISGVLGIGVEYLGQLGEQRAAQLFDSQEFIDKVVAEVQKSQDFAATTYDIWLRYNLESSERRREHLKHILENITDDSNRDFENFTHIFNTAQTITEGELRALAAFYSDVAYKYSKIGKPSPNRYTINAEDVMEMVGTVDTQEAREELIAQMTQIGHYGLVFVSYNTMNGPYFSPNRLGRIFIEYVNGK